MTLEDALESVLASAWRLGEERVALGAALGRYLAAPASSDRDLPPFDRSMLDGFACRSIDLPGPLRQVDAIMAGDESHQALPAGACVRIMTGAPVPAGADYVFGIEHAELGVEGVMFTGQKGKQNNIARRAEDVRAGEVVLDAGTRLAPQHLAVLATVGVDPVPVARRPRVGILATGTELVPVSQVPTAAQIRNSNSIQLATLAQLAGAETVDLGIAHDDREAQRASLAGALDSCDVLVSSGGVSVGDRDFVPELLGELGLEIRVRKVDIQPGKPIVFGVRNSNRPVAAFALAGNPLSSYVQFLLIVRPFLAALQGGLCMQPALRVALREPITRANAGRTLYRPVRLEADGTASVTGYHGSGHLTSYTAANALAIVPQGVSRIDAGDSVDLLLLD